MSRFTYQDYQDGLCTRKQYRQGLNPPAIAVGSVYVQAKGTWYEKHFKIVHIEGSVAMAVSVWNKISNEFIGDYELFNVADGFKYNDERETYRLSEVLK